MDTTILDGKSEHVAHVRNKKGLSRKNVGFSDFYEVTRCLQQVEIPELLTLCAPFIEILSYINSMDRYIKKGCLAL